MSDNNNAAVEKNPRCRDNDDDDDCAATTTADDAGWRLLPRPDWFFLPVPRTLFTDDDENDDKDGGTNMIAIPGFLRPFLGLDVLPVTPSSSSSVCGRYSDAGEDHVEQQRGDGSGGNGAGGGNNNNNKASGIAVTPDPVGTAVDEQRPCSLYDGGEEEEEEDGVEEHHRVRLVSTPRKSGTEPDDASAVAAENDDDDDDVGTSSTSSGDDDPAVESTTPLSSSLPSSSLSAPRLDSSGTNRRRHPLLWSQQKNKKMWHSLRILPSSSSSSSWSSSKTASKASQTLPTKNRDETSASRALKDSGPLTGLSSIVSSIPTPRRQRHQIHSSDDVPSSSADDLRSQREQKLRSIQRHIHQGRERVQQMERAAATAHKKVVQLQEALKSERASWEEQKVALAHAQIEVEEWQAQAEALQRDRSDDGPSRRRRSHTADAAYRRRRQTQLAPLEKCASETGLLNPVVSPERPMDDVTDPLSFDRDETTTSMPPARPRASTDSKLVKKTSLAAFMRVSDLAVEGPPRTTNLANGMDGHDSFSSFTNGSDDDDSNINNSSQHSTDFYWLDENFAMVLDRLWKLGWEHATDESSGRFRFVGSGGRGSNSHQLGPHNCVVRISDGGSSGWPVRPWHEPLGTSVLLWVGSSLPSEDGLRHHHGHDWPIVKVRGLVDATPRQVVDLLLDSNQVHVYNKLSAERHDQIVLQEGVDMSADDSLYGFAGLAKVTRSILKPRLLPKPIETVALWHAKPLPRTYAMPSNKDGAVMTGYMIVTRSVWDGTTVPSPNGGGHNVPSSTPSVLRSEMLLGVHLCRPICFGTSNKVICELTSVTHVVPTGVPEYLAKKMAPSTAVATLEAIQSHFATK